VPAVRVQALVAVPAEQGPVVVLQAAVRVRAVVLLAARPAVVRPQVVAQQLVQVVLLPVVLPQLAVLPQPAQVLLQRRVQQLLLPRQRLVWWLPVWRLRRLWLPQWPKRLTPFTKTPPPSPEQEPTPVALSRAALALPIAKIYNLSKNAPSGAFFCAH